MKILFKETGLHAFEYVHKPIVDALRLLDISITNDISEEVDFVYYGNNNSYEYYASLPKSTTKGFPIEFLLKSHLQDMAKSAGINYLPNEVLANESTITNFPDISVILKPIQGALSRRTYSFVYKLYATKAELITDIANTDPTFFVTDESGYTPCTDYIIQQAIMPDSSGYSNLFFVPVFINGQGKMIDEGMANAKMTFNELHDIAPELYPLGNLRVETIRDTEDHSDQYNILQQLQQLIDFYSIKNTPMNMQWIVDAAGKSYLIDVGFNFQRGSYFISDIVSPEFFADKLKFVYDLQPTIQQPMTGWIGLIDLFITSDYSDTMSYIIGLGFHAVNGWMPINKNGPSKIKVFGFNFSSRKEFDEKVNLARIYIRDNTATNTLMF